MIVVFSKEWFAKYNKQICWLANSFVGQFVFRFKKFGHYIENRIVKITPNSVCEFMGMKEGKIEVKEHFFGRNEYAIRLQNVFYPIWITFHIWDIITRPVPQLNLGFDTLTVYPDADPETTSVDGFCVNKPGGTPTWSDVANGAGTGANTNAGFNNCILISAGPDYWKEVVHGFFLFDTSALTSEATISAAVLSLYGQNKADSFTTPIAPNINIYTSNPASNTDLVAGDYDSAGSTAQCDTAITYSGYSTSSYNDFTLNSTGRGNVSKTGISKFSTRNANYDVADSAPTFEANKFSFLYTYFADNGSNKPKLVVTYSTVVGPANLKSFNGLSSASIKSINSVAIASMKSINGLE